MSDTTIRALALLAGQGDLMAAQRLVIELQRAGHPGTREDAAFEILREARPVVCKLLEDIWKAEPVKKLRITDAFECHWGGGVLVSLGTRGCASETAGRDHAAWRSGIRSSPSAPPPPNSDNARERPFPGPLGH